jgi:hypothetical protein
VLKRLFTGLVALVAGAGAAICAFFGASILLRQVGSWLKDASWPSVTIADQFKEFGVPPPSTPSMLGMQKLIESVLSWPAWVGYFLLAAICYFVFAIAREEQTGFARTPR